MRKIRILCLLALVLTSLTGYAQHDFQVVRGNCLPEPDDVAAARSQAPRKLPPVNRDWNPNKVYKQPVILITYSKTNDTVSTPCIFAMEEPRAFYDKIFNERGYNLRAGKGCVADYYRDQSNGMFYLEFDVFGPYMVDTLAQPYKDATTNTRNYGRYVLHKAAEMWVAENPTLDYKQYDWNGDGEINQVIYVSASYGGNISDKKCYGYIWPNTSSFSTITTPDGTSIKNYTASAELWNNNASCGIGTICHEFTHSLGLPDIYPVGSSNALPFSMMDEWELMDGGNFTNYGWCPPNFTPLEKMLMGWLTPTELTDPTSIKDLKPSADGGEIYQIKHTDNEYLLLENRQWSGWDAGLPGKGLVIYHVNYDAGKWSSNVVNGTVNNYGYSLVHADNLDYAAWDNLYWNWYDAHRVSRQYQNAKFMNKWHFSSSPYPWATDSTDVVNSELTDASVPAAQMYTENAEGSTLLGKPITNIQMTEDGLISFDFMGGDKTGIENSNSQSPILNSQFYDLQGRRVPNANGRGIYIQRRADGTIKKCLNKLYIY